MASALGMIPQGKQHSQKPIIGWVTKMLQNLFDAFV
jgi:hypothetical protein